MQYQKKRQQFVLTASTLALLFGGFFAQAKDSNSSNECAAYLGRPAIVSRLGDLQNMLLGPVDKLHRQMPSPFAVVDELLDRPDEWTDEASELLLEVTTLAFRTAHLHEFQKADLLRLTAQHGLYSPELIQLVTSEITKRPVLRFISDGSPNSGQFLLAFLERSRANGWRPSQQIALQLKQAQKAVQLAFSQRDKERYPYVFADWSQETVHSDKGNKSLLMPFLVEDFIQALRLYTAILEHG